MARHRPAHTGQRTPGGIVPPAAQPAHGRKGGATSRTALDGVARRGAIGRLSGSKGSRTDALPLDAILILRCLLAPWPGFEEKPVQRTNRPPTRCHSASAGPKKRKARQPPCGSTPPLDSAFIWIYFICAPRRAGSPAKLVVNQTSP